MSENVVRRMVLAMMTVVTCCLVALPSRAGDVVGAEELASAGIWRAATDQGTYADIASAGSWQVSFVLPRQSRHFLLRLKSAAAEFQPQTPVAIKVTFDGADTMTLRGAASATVIEAGIPDDQLAAWTHGFTARRSMLIEIPDIGTLSLSLAGTTPTVTALAKSLKAAGITDLPPPWGSPAVPQQALPAIPVTPPVAEQQPPAGSDGDRRDESLEADDRAEALANMAFDGDQSSLNILKSEAGRGSSSMMFGLGRYFRMDFERQYKNMALMEHPTLDLYVAEASPEIGKRLGDFARKSRQHDPTGARSDAADKLYMQTLGLWRSAANADDPAAEGALGADYWAQMSRFTMFTDYVANAGHAEGQRHDRNAALASLISSPDGSGPFIIAALTRLCAESRNLLIHADRHGVPDAAFNLSFFYAPFDATLLTFTNCVSTDTARARTLWIRSASLGSADAVMALLDESSRANDRAGAARWQRRLEELSSQGNRRAVWLLAHEEEVLKGSR